MARATIAAQTTPGAYPTLPVGAGTRDLAFYASDVVNLNDCTIVEGKTLVLIKNDDVSAQTVTFLSTPDIYGREGDITTYSLAAGDIALFGPFKAAGWSNAGKLDIDTSDADVKICVITLP